MLVFNNDPARRTNMFGAVKYQIKLSLLEAMNFNSLNNLSGL